MIDGKFPDKLANLRATHCAQLPTPEMAVLARGIARLRRSGILEQCLQPGETVPNFQFIDPNDRQTDLYALLQTGPVVVSFFRGFWCPFCRAELTAWTEVRETLESAGCHYLPISPQKVSVPPAGHDVIFDRENQIARQFGIVYTLTDEEVTLFRSWGLELDRLNHSSGRELPLPATYLVAKDRTVAWHFVDVDFRNRPLPQELVEQARRMG